MYGKNYAELRRSVVTMRRKKSFLSLIEINPLTRNMLRYVQDIVQQTMRTRYLV